jgi:hypothetical protein
MTPLPEHLHGEQQCYDRRTAQTPPRQQASVTVDHGWDAEDMQDRDGTFGGWLDRSNRHRHGSRYASQLRRPAWSRSPAHTNSTQRMMATYAA